MQSLILTTTTRLLAALLIVFSVYALLRGHNLPGGGFIAGLIVAIALLMQAIASGYRWTCLLYTSDAADE